MFWVSESGAKCLAFCFPSLMGEQPGSELVLLKPSVGQNDKLPASSLSVSSRCKLPGVGGGCSHILRLRLQVIGTLALYTSGAWFISGDWPCAHGSVGR